MTEQKKPEAEKSWLQAIRETIYGMAAHDMSRAALRTRSSMVGNCAVSLLISAEFDMVQSPDWPRRPSMPTCKTPPH